MKKRSIASPLFLTVVLLLLYLPIVVVIAYSFNNNMTKNSALFTGFTFHWYEELFRDTRGFMDSLRVSLQLALYSCGLSVVLGTLGAVGMARRASAPRASALLSGAVENLVTIPIMIPEIILGMAFMALFYAIDLPFGMVTLVIAHVTFCVPYIYLIVKGRLYGMDPSLPEAARDLGASPFRVFFDITLPLVFPGILSGAFLALAMSLDDFIISFFVNGAGTVTLPLKIYSSVKVGVSPQINALCTVMLGIVFLCVAVSQLIGSRRRALKRKDHLSLLSAPASSQRPL